MFDDVLCQSEPINQKSANEPKPTVLDPAWPPKTVVQSSSDVGSKAERS